MSQTPNEPAARLAGGFHSTHWSLVGRAAENSRPALEELCAAYWPPVRYHLVRMGYDAAQADDLTQAFFARLLEKRLLDAADAGRGRFRTFLLTALHRFLINEWKHDGAAKRGGNAQRVALDTQPEAAIGRDETPQKQFERQWAIVVLERAFAALEAEQQAAGKLTQFEMLSPLINGDGDASYEELAAKLGATAGALRMNVSRLRTRLRELIRGEIGQTVGGEAEVDDEIQSLFEALRR